MRTLLHGHGRACAFSPAQSTESGAAYSPAEGSDQDRDRAQANASLPFFKAEPMEWSESFTLGVTVSLLVIGAIFVIVLVGSYWRYLRTHAVEQKFEPPYTPYEGVS